MKLILIVLLSVAVKLFPLTDTLAVNEFLIILEDGKFTAFAEDRSKLLSLEFVNPELIIADLDEDTSGELIIIDAVSPVEHKLYIFNTINSFFLVDSINSGSVLPYYTPAEESGEIVLVTGNNDFSFIESDGGGFIPLNVWKFDAGELYLVNDEIYDLFIAENDLITSLIDEFYNVNNSNCNSAKSMKAAIAAAYVNYLNAGEHSLASQFLKKYYLCNDLEEFRQKLDDLVLIQE